MYWIILAFSDRLQIPGSPEPPSASETHCFDESQPAPPNRNLPSAGWANAQAAKRFGAGRIPVQWLVLDKHETTHMKKHSWITTLKRHVNMFDSYVWLNLKFVWFLPRVRFATKTNVFFLWGTCHVGLPWHDASNSTADRLHGFLWAEAMPSGVQGETLVWEVFPQEALAE